MKYIIIFIVSSIAAGFLRIAFSVVGWVWVYFWQLSSTLELFSSVSLDQGISRRVPGAQRWPVANKISIYVVDSCCSAPVGLHEVSWFRHSLLADNAHSAVTVVSAYARFSNCCGLCHCCVTISRWQLLFLPPCPQRRERFHPVGKRPVERNRTHFVKVSVDPGITLLWLSRLKRAANPLSLNKSCLRLFMLQFFRFFCAHSEYLSLSILDSSVALNVFLVLV